MGHRITTCKNNMCACAYGNAVEDGEVESEDEIITYRGERDASGFSDADVRSSKSVVVRRRRRTRDQ